MTKSTNLVKVRDACSCKEFVFINDQVIGIAYIEVDGFYVFVPANLGFWSSYMMKMITERLDELNEYWDLQLSKEIEDKSL